MQGFNDQPTFPKQSISYREKTTKWYKDCIDAGVSIVDSDNGKSYRSLRQEKVSNINLFHDVVDKEEIESVINPYNLSGKFPDTYKNYPISNSNLNLLFGEERKRIFNPTSYVINSDIINTDQDVITEKFKEFLQENVMQEEFDQEQSKKALMNLDKFRKYTYQDMYERMSNQVIQFFLNATDMREHWSKNFEDLLIQGEEIASIDILGGSVIFERLNPIDVFTFRSKDSYKIEDSDWIAISRYEPIGEVIDNYREYLSSSDKKHLDDIYTTKTAGSKLFPDGQLLNQNQSLEETVQQIGLDKIIYSGKNGAKTTQQEYDESGNVRVIRVLWKGQRKIGIVEFKDKDGSKQKKYVDERYKPNTELGEKIKWEYISEWYEGTRIAGNIYVKYGPRPIQFRDPDNPSLCHPGIVGNILNTNSNRGKSLLSYMKPYQLLYNFFMYRLQQDFLKYQGHIARFNTTMKPDGWSMEKVMYYMQQFGIMVEDPFNEGQEGAATGKLAGGIGYNPGGSIQIGDSNIIQMNMMMLEFLENRIADISGVTPQRKGAIDNRETVGGVERSVMQSSNNTEKYFGLHDNFRLRCLKVLVGTCAVAWKDKKEKKTFVLDDGTRSILNFNGEKFKEGVYGIATVASSDVTNMMNDIRALSQPFMQNGGSVSAIIDIYQTKDPASLKRKMEQYEEDLQRKQEESEQRQLQAQQEQIDSAERLRAEEMEHERLLNEMDNETKIQIELLKQENEDNSLELEKVKQNKEKISGELKLKERALKETERSNRVNESLKQKQINKPQTTKK